MKHEVFDGTGISCVFVCLCVRARARVYERAAGFRGEVHHQTTKPYGKRVGFLAGGSKQLGQVPLYVNLVNF